MKAKQKAISGYQVRSADLKGISFEHRDLETCKRYCRKGYVIVSTYRKKSAFRISLTLFGKRYHWWSNLCATFSLASTLPLNRTCTA